MVILGSGSRGNSLLVAGPRTRVLVDMGFPQRRVVAQLAAEGLRPDDLAALLVTHTHTDHVSDPAMKFCWRHRVPLVAPAENLAVLRRRFPGVGGRLDRSGLLRPLPPKGHHINGLDVRPFLVPHDADALTLGYHLTFAGPRGEPTRVAVATDLGHAPPEVLRVLSAAEVLVLEANHDLEMLETSGRPPYLIDRIAGSHGHLSNEQAAEAIAEILAAGPPGRMKRLVLAHLSQECNEPRLARRVIRRALAPLGKRAPRLLAATQDAPLTVLAGR